jgi:hypothetical protein
MKRWLDVSDAGSTPAASTTYFYGGVIGFDEAYESSWRIGNAEAVRIGISRSKKQTKILANDEYYALAA